MNRIVFIVLILMATGVISASAKGEGLKYLLEGDSVARIPASLKKIPDNAFEDCKSLKKVVFDNNSQCADIGKYAFLGCENLTEITLPSSVTSLGEGAFRECASLRQIAIPSRVTAIPRYCFYGCSSLEEISLPKALKDIAKLAFIYCAKLDGVNLPSTLTHIGNNAFSRCESLSTISVPDNVLELESYAFSDCFSLTEAKLPANRKMLGELIFSGCRSLERLIEPSYTPPTFDCESFIFEPDDAEAYERCSLVVKSGRASSYKKAHGWRLFENIIEE